MSNALIETPLKEIDWGWMPPAPPLRPVASSPEDPERCGLCGEKKIKLPLITKRQGLPVLVCTNIMKDEDMPCDGYVWKNAAFNFADFYDA